MEPARIGITFSHPHIQYLDISIDEALKYALLMGFSHIRIGSYWSRVEKYKDMYDFGEIEQILERCEKAGQKIIMNVGMKSPRWPEFYIPPHIKDKNIEGREVSDRALVFIERTIKKLKSYQCITHWQVENEPLDPSGESNLVIPLSTLKDEVMLVRSLDQRPIIISLWGNEMQKRRLAPVVESLADVVGLDIYYKQFRGELFGRSLYIGPQTSDTYFSKLIHDCSKPMIVTELQAEPWEKNNKAYLSEKQTSISPELLRRNIQRALNLGVKEILLWGYEYWYYQMKKGNDSYMQVLTEFGYHTPNEGEPDVVEGGK